MMGRTLEVMNYYQSMLGLLRAKAGHPGISFRYVIGPSEVIASKTVPIVIYMNLIITIFRVLMRHKLTYS